MDNQVTTKDAVKEVIGTTVGLSAMIFVMACLESSSTATGIVSKIIRRVAIAGIGWATFDIVDAHAKSWVDEAACTVDAWQKYVELQKKQ